MYTRNARCSERIPEETGGDHVQLERSKFPILSCWTGLLKLAFINFFYVAIFMTVIREFLLVAVALASPCCFWGTSTGFHPKKKNLGVSYTGLHFIYTRAQYTFPLPAFFPPLSFSIFFGGRRFRNLKLFWSTVTYLKR